MTESKAISPEMKAATDVAIVNDEYARTIASIERQIKNHEDHIEVLKLDLQSIKESRPSVIIKWRDSIRWCLEVDAENWRFFLKNASGVYKCIAYRHKVELTADIKNKIAVTLSALYKEKSIGRLSYNGIHLYGLTKFFNNDLTDLKEEYKLGLDKLIL